MPSHRLARPFSAASSPWKLGRFDNEQADVVEQMLAPDVLPKTAQDGIANRASRFHVARPHHFAKPLDAKGDADAIHGLGNSICVSHHNVAGPQGNRRFTNEVGDVLFQPQWKTKIESVVSFEGAVDADDKNLFVLPADGNDFILIVKQTQREVAIAVHAANV